MIKTFIRQYRVELATFAVALTISLGYLVWNEMQKPNGGLLRYLRGEVRILHKETGEVLAAGPTRRRAVERHLNRRYSQQTRDFIDAMPRETADLLSPWDEDQLLRWRDRLDGADLRNEDFSSADLRRLTLRNALCDNANFQYALLLSADLSGSCFVGANLDGAALGRSDLSHTDFSNAICTRVDFTETKLKGANFSASNISDSVFVGAVCENANFDGVTFSERTNFRGALLEGARNISEALRDHIIATGGHLTAPDSAPESPTE